MTKIILTFVLYLFSIVVFSQSELKEKSSTKQFNITVSIANINGNKGTVYFALHTKDTFLKKGIIALKSKVNNNATTVTFKNITKGTYAILCFYDKNDNGKMDFDKNSMPLEDYGSSNNPLLYGPPNFNASKFDVINKDLTFEIKF